MVFHWSLCVGKSPQVTRTLLSILAVLNNVVIWMVSTSPPTSKSSSPISNPLVPVPKVPITIGIIVTFMFHSFFSSLARLRNLSVCMLKYHKSLCVAFSRTGAGLSPLEFFTSVSADGFSLESEWQQVSSGLQDSFQDSTRPPTSKSSRPFNNPLVIVPKAPITIGKIVTFNFTDFSIL